MTAQTADKPEPSSASGERSLREGEDFYRDGLDMVFTAAYHLRRGTCCKSGCRHCPYPKADEVASVVNTNKK